MRRRAAAERGWARLRAGLDAGDPDEEIWYAHIVKEALRSVYRADDEDDARTALAEFYDAAASAGLLKADRLAETIRRWAAEVLAYYASDWALQRTHRSPSTVW